MMTGLQREMKVVILLTGCIDPGGMSFTKLLDPEVRRSQYIEAIRYYLGKTTIPILFVENSGVDISAVFENEIVDGRLEIITFPGNQYDKSRGKGFGEMLIIEKAVSDSNLLKNADFVFKITGRYKLLNLVSYLNQYKNNSEVELLVDLRQNLRFSDSRVWGSTLRFLEKILLRYKDKVNDSQDFYFEHALCRATHEAISKKYRFCGLRHSPRFSGVYATENKKYRSSLIFWLPSNLKHQLRYYFLKRKLSRN